MKIIDCFTFYNEMDLLNYRLNILYDVVDYFVIVESTHTHVGKEKPLFYKDNKHLFEKFNDKIVHIIVDDFPYKYPAINIANGEQWENERFQRNQIKKGIEKINNIDNNDILIITDLDEIPDPNTLIKIKNKEIKVDIQVLQMDLYHYNLNTIASGKWPSARILTYEKYIKLSISCNDIRFYNCPIIKNAGWHLSYFGDSNFIKNKIENFGHQEFNNAVYNNIESLTDKINNFKNIFADNGTLRKILIEDNVNLPYKYDIYLQKYIVC
jgi:beta-1,4-mannosyl-glycoprotein beta-1,4-N-acetylglucosaminyltransferase